MDKSLSKREFEVGKTYRWVGPSTYSDNFSSEMNEWLKGTPHKCTSVVSEHRKKVRATFEGIKANTWRGDHTWDYAHCMRHFVEVVPDEFFFEVGKYYRWTGPQDYDCFWNRLMEPWKDRKPRRCTRSQTGHYASFDGIEEGCWHYDACIHYFEEVKDRDVFDCKRPLAFEDASVIEWSSIADYRREIIARRYGSAIESERAREATEGLPVVNVATIQQSILDLI